MDDFTQDELTAQALIRLCGAFSAWEHANRDFTVRPAHDLESSTAEVYMSRAGQVLELTLTAVSAEKVRITNQSGYSLGEFDIGDYAGILEKVEEQFKKR